MRLTYRQPRGGRVSPNGRERGSVSIEAALLIPTIAVLVGITMMAGRLRTANTSVAQTVRDAARAASLTRTPAEARTAAYQAVAADVKYLGLKGLCDQAVVATGDMRSYLTGTGAAHIGQITVTLTCHVPLSDLTMFPGVPGKQQLKEHFTSVVDVYRSQQ